jgi:hypothetical protein
MDLPLTSGAKISATQPTIITTEQFFDEARTLQPA